MSFFLNLMEAPIFLHLSSYDMQSNSVKKISEVCASNKNIFERYLSPLGTKLQYNKIIKDAFINSERNNNDYIDANFRGKNTFEFWRASHSKFSYSINKQISINVLNDNFSIANAFANQFGSF